ncbi:hypothetical protein HHK36_027782 [Tetracentron sinense]|uniref:Replication factor C C-terminal domain-containing protein n=1 Tax=Tetracentron sinense TaxID=13715 RepID=A0A834YHA2_TETSI|nr:hypothetical protein HHK36_027782 [Tetracentron sinense]
MATSSGSPWVENYRPRKVADVVGNEDWLQAIARDVNMPNLILAEGLEAIIFTAHGDMREASNNLQATFNGFRFVNQENVSKVCDQPHVKNMVRDILEAKFDDACFGLKQLYDLGYSPTDIITTLFRIIKNCNMA